MTAADTTNYSCIAGSGYICAIGTEFKQSFPCPAGTYNNNNIINTVAGCVACLAGYACHEGTGTASFANKMILCEPGYYCEAGMTHTRQKPCPEGTYNPSRGSSTSGACLSC
jgi:hypothetical protein